MYTFIGDAAMVKEGLITNSHTQPTLILVILVHQEFSSGVPIRICTAYLRQLNLLPSSMIFSSLLSYPITECEQRYAFITCY